MVAVSRAPTDGVRISVRVRPGARRDEVGGSWAAARGPALVVAVRARAVEGAANAAVVAALAAAFGVRRGNVEIVAGARGRDKVVAVRGDHAELTARLAQLMA
ncbi:hypothetical protein FHX44_118444 [Pseudonocardia hierapolitana]|uniref:UPF0235 protein FHX44_118444 n=1 Tax=Pseudonocardia hierapolitana TaxID=1128676 RepID=A0A561T5V8_9PSEU|nr:hypothetical protein FHX44_118444 [Pseudonocardia hierapolitana]